MGGTGLVCLLLLLAALAPIIVRGARFGRVVGWLMPATRGAISVAGGSWSWSGAWAIWRGRPATLSLDGIRIVDPEGVDVLRAEHVEGTVELSRDRARLVLRDLHIRHAFWRFAQMKAGRDVGFLAAMQPLRRVAARPRARGGGLASLAIAGAQLDGVDVIFDLPAWGLSLTDVHARGQLALTAAAGDAGTGTGTSADGRGRTARAAFTFEVADADLRGGGLLRVLGGQARSELPFSSGRIDRVATTAARPDRLELAASGVATGAARLTLNAWFGGVYGGSGDRAHGSKAGAGAGHGGAIELHAHFTDAADAVRAVLARRFRAGAAPVTVAGPGAVLDLGVLGPFDQVRVESSLRGFDLGARGLSFAGVAGTLTVEPAAGRARLVGLTFASPAGGRLALDAEVDRLLIQGTLALDHFATAPYLPPFLRPLAGGALDGRVRAALDLVGRTASLERVDLTFTPPTRAPGARLPGHPLRLVAGAGTRVARAPKSRAQIVQLDGARFARGTLVLPEVAFELAGGRVSGRARLTLTDDQGHLRPPIIDVDARARRISFTQLAGATFATGDLDFRARAKGALDDLTLTIDVPADQSLRVFGEVCQLPASTTLRFDGRALTLPDFRLRGRSGSELAFDGRIQRDGEVAVTLEVRGFPLGKLPGVADAELPISGTLSGRLRASGPAREPRLEGQITIAHTQLQGRPIGGGMLTIRPGPGGAGAISGTGQVMEGVAFDGTMAPAGGSVRGTAKLQLRAVRLDPFLALLLPGGARASGVVSGTLEARVAPHAPPEVEGRISELALTVTGATPHASRPGGPAAPPPTLELHALDEVRLSARAGGGPIRIEAARFAGTAGSVELAGESVAGNARAWVRGRLALGAIAPVVMPWSRGTLTRLAGDLDFDIAAQAARDAVPVVTGTVRVATPVSLRVAGLPFDARLASGSLRLDGDGTTHLDLPVTLGAGTLRLTGVVTSPMDGDPRVTVDLDGDLDAGLLALAAPTTVAWATGGARLHAHVEGRPLFAGAAAGDDLRVRARLSPAPLTLALRAWPGVAIQVAGGPIDLDQHSLSARALRLTVAGTADLTIGAPVDGAAVVELGSLQRPRPGRVTLPVRGRVTASPVAPLVVDDASLALRLDGDLTRRARLTGEVTVTAAHVPPGKARRKATPAAGKATGIRSAATSSWLRRPELARIDLDVRARARRGAVTVELDNLPDVHVGVDYRVRGTPLAPQISGDLQGADLFSSFALFLRRIFQ
ncbi:MAG TPA: hypothetical protein VFH68_04085 [Polyangia bacterium]|nr:hypothetical protein [Polyangia bacterium]